MENEKNPAERSLLRRIYRCPPNGESREVKNQALCKYFNGEIARLDGTTGQPFPPPQWKINARQENP
jgi:hypothetical protein